MHRQLWPVKKRQTIFYDETHFQLKIPSPGYTHHGKQIKDNESEEQRKYNSADLSRNTTYLRFYIKLRQLMFFNYL